MESQPKKLGYRSVFSAEDLPRTVFRFIPVHRLWEIMETQKVTFLRCTKWEDPFEGFLAKRYCRDTGKSDYNDLISRLYFMCCTTEREKDHIWRNYTPNRDGVRIEISTSALLKADNRLQGRGISYEKKNAITLKLRRFERTKQPVRDLFFVKRFAFEDECEIRFFIDTKNETDKVSISFSPRHVIRSVLFDPRMHSDVYKLHRKFIQYKWPNMPVTHSKLYDPDGAFPD